MRFQEIKESSTVAGNISTISKPLGEVQSRTDVKGLKPVGQLSKKKGPYANSLTEGKMKDLEMDLKDLKDAEFKKKYNKTKQEMRDGLKNKPKKVEEAKLDEEDIILVPGQGRKMKTGFVPHGQSRVDHEVEMAKSDLYQAAQNAEKVLAMIKHVSEDEGLEGWVQEKIIKANDYLNTVREYLEGKHVQEMTGGVIAGGEQYESRTEVKDKSGKVVSWKDDTDWHKVEKNKKGQPKDPRGMVTHLSDVARRKTEKQPAEEGAKVDRMVKHIEKSEKKLGHSKKEAENIAWATANKRGMLNNKNKK